VLQKGENLMKETTKITMVPLALPLVFGAAERERATKNAFLEIIALSQSLWLNLTKWGLEEKVELIRLEHDFFQKDGNIHGINMSIVFIPDNDPEKLRINLFWRKPERQVEEHNEQGLVSHSFIRDCAATPAQAASVAIKYLSKKMDIKSSKLKEVSERLLKAAQRR
jgi:hypothetical protein